MLGAMPATAHRVITKDGRTADTYGTVPSGSRVQ